MRMEKSEKSKLNTKKNIHDFRLLVRTFVYWKANIIFKKKNL